MADEWGGEWQHAPGWVLALMFLFGALVICGGLFVFMTGTW